MNTSKIGLKVAFSILWIILGATLLVLGTIEKIDEFWNGFGVGLVAVGILQAIRLIRYRSDDNYKEKVDVEVNDERNKFISIKAWSYTGYIFVLCAAVCSIVFRVIGKDEYSSMCALAISLMCIIYFVSYIILKRKY